MPDGMGYYLGCDFYGIVVGGVETMGEGLHQKYIK